MLFIFSFWHPLNLAALCDRLVCLVVKPVLQTIIKICLTLCPNKCRIKGENPEVHIHYTLPKCWQHEGFTGVLVSKSAGRLAGGEMGFRDRAELIFDSKPTSEGYHGMNSCNLQ
jgi:hypothetical protein